MSIGNKLFLCGCIVLLTACGGGGSSDNAVSVANITPLVNAGTDISVQVSSSVSLNGTASDADGSIVSYQWTQISGSPDVSLSGASTASASFTAPEVSVSTILEFELEVTDNDGATAIDAVSVTVTVAPVVAPEGLTIRPGATSAELSWLAVTGADSYTLYYATESFGSPADLENYASFSNGTMLMNLTATTSTVTGLNTNTRYYFVVSATNDAGESDASTEVNAWLAVLRLNDTGITFGGDYPSGNNTDCSSNITSEQDCHQGRDVTHNDDSDGHAGFSYTKLDANGEELAASALDWSCVQDNVTGLIWEVKTTDGGLHDSGDAFNWYNTDVTTNGGAVGFADDDGDICEGYDNGNSTTFCNTQAYTARVNNAGLCGAADWRLPSLSELSSIRNKGTFGPAIDSDYFPNSASGFYWSSSPYAGDSVGAWGVNFLDGNGGIGYRGSFDRVRLVRGGQ